MNDRIKIEEPKVCPFCGAKIERHLENGAHLYCSNPKCKERVLQKINYFVAKPCMNIEFISEKTLSALQNNGKLSAWYDLYKLKKEDLILSGIGDIMSDKILDSIQKSLTNVKSYKILMALGIPMLGKVSAEKLISYFGSIENIFNASLDELKQCPNLGNVAAETIYEYIKENYDELVPSITIFKPACETTYNVTNKLDSKSFLATGKLNNFSRESIKESILENGGKYSSGINKSLDYLIVGENAGKAKLDKAAALNIKIISEEEYLKMLQSI